MSFDLRTRSKSKKKGVVGRDPRTLKVCKGEKMGNSRPTCIVYSMRQAADILATHRDFETVSRLCEERVDTDKFLPHPELSAASISRRLSIDSNNTDNNRQVKHKPNRDSVENKMCSDSATCPLYTADRNHDVTSSSSISEHSMSHTNNILPQIKTSTSPKQRPDVMQLSCSSNVPKHNQEMHRSSVSECKPPTVIKLPELASEQQMLMVDGFRAPSGQRLPPLDTCISVAQNTLLTTKSASTLRKYAKAKLKKAQHFDEQECKEDIKMVVDVQPTQHFLKHVFAPSPKQAAKDKRERRRARRRQPRVSAALDDIVVNPYNNHNATQRVAEETDLSELKVLFPIICGPSSDNLRRKVMWQTYKQHVEVDIQNGARHEQLHKKSQKLPLEIPMKDWYAKPVELPYTNYERTDRSYHLKASKHAISKPHVPENLKSKRKPISILSKAKTTKIPKLNGNQRNINDGISKQINKQQPIKKPTDTLNISEQNQTPNLNPDNICGEIIERVKRKDLTIDFISGTGAPEQKELVASALKNIINTQCSAEEVKDKGQLNDFMKSRIQYYDSRTKDTAIRSHASVTNHVEQTADLSRIKKASCQLKNRLHLKALPCVVQTSITVGKKKSSEEIKHIWH